VSSHERKCEKGQVTRNYGWRKHLVTKLADTLKTILKTKGEKIMELRAEMSASALRRTSKLKGRGENSYQLPNRNARTTRRLNPKCQLHRHVRMLRAIET
jgi:nucleoid DNA-binding protein